MTIFQRKIKIDILDHIVLLLIVIFHCFHFDFGRHDCQCHRLHQVKDKFNDELEYCSSAKSITTSLYNYFSSLHKAIGNTILVIILFLASCLLGGVCIARGVLFHKYYRARYEPAAYPVAMWLINLAFLSLLICAPILLCTYCRLPKPRPETSYRGF